MQFVLSISGNFLIVGKGRALQRRQMRGLLCNVSLIHNNISSLWSACMAPLGHVIHFKIISVVFLQRSSVNSDMITKHSSPFRSSCYAPLKDLQVITPDRPSYFIVQYFYFIFLFYIFILHFIFSLLFYLFWCVLFFMKCIGLFIFILFFIPFY